MSRRYSFSFLGILVFAVPATFVAAQAPAVTESFVSIEQQSLVDTEIRTLKQGSAFRAAMERKLGSHRIAPEFQLQLRSAPGAHGSQSIIDLIESQARTKTDWDPYADPIEPNGSGSHRGQTQSTHVNCASVNIGGSSQAGNITWNWTYTPDSDTNGDGQVTNTDSCPCSWTLTTVVIELHTASGALEC